MIVNSATLDALRVGFRTDFQAGIDSIVPQRDRVAMTVPSTGRANTYGWLRDLEDMREWIGPRHVESLSEASYTITNAEFEKTISVRRTDIEDDNLGQYALRFRLLGFTAAAKPERLVWDLLKNGFTEEAFDGQPFFDTDHPIRDKNGAETVYSNTQGGAGTPWFLMSTRRAIRPIIYQLRKAPEFVSRDQPTDSNVFDRGEFLYGVDMRANVGFGLPQLAVGSKQVLDKAAFKDAFAMIEGMTGDGGRPLGLLPDLLVVPPALREAGLEILNAERDAAGATNVWRGTAELLVVPWLA